MAKRVVAFGAVAALLSWTATTSHAENLDVPTSFDLAAAQDSGAAADAPVTRMYWDIEGSIRLRSADTQEPGTLDWKNFFRYGTASDHTDDDTVYEIWMQWGMAENLEMNARLPIEFGDAGQDSPDLRLSWQWKFLEEEDWMPGTAVFYEIRTPTGYHSSGTDHEFRLIMTKSLIADQWRVHVNPFIKWLNGDPDRVTKANGPQKDFWGDPDQPQTQRDFEWGFILGTDYALDENMSLGFDYILDSGEVNGFRMQHEMEVAFDMTLDNGHALQLATGWTLDGDSQGPNFTATIGYMIPLGHVGQMTWATAEVPYPAFTSGEE